MDVGQITSALSNKLVIEDIDESDRDNPQLCAEYVKEIYAYMRELEVHMYMLLCNVVHHLQFVQYVLWLVVGLGLVALLGVYGTLMYSLMPCNKPVSSLPQLLHWG